MKLTFWPFTRRRSNPPETTIVSARFIRTDVPGRGDLRLRSPLCRLGRAPDNDLCFDNDSVSGRHAEIYHLPDGTFQLCDLDSTNGTWINGQRIHGQIMNNGDVVELGEVRLHFRLEDS
ncbi:MAG: FHA domain-containing protein [Candidatus Competibacter sp.]|nr:FHA domain-containing protein [Candidatus Competibacter sp.]MDG4605965.1 FHA domain-containing protein [Candidatus Contendobacter sp.]HRD50269.1 FHA domain-containing protein [Candidatus Contendobacter sp.]